MDLLRHTSKSSGRKGFGPTGRMLVKRLSIIAIFLICGLFLRVPAGATLQGLCVGTEAPDFSLKDLNGRKWTFANAKGKKLTMVIFWSTWSRNSAKALKRAQKLYSAYKDKGLSVVAVNDDSQELAPAEVVAIKKMSAGLDLEYPVLLDRGLTAFHDYGVIAIPSTVILDPARKVLYELSGYPLVGSSEMLDFVSAQLEGRKPKAVAQHKGYQPDERALRYYNMGMKALHSKRMTAMAPVFLKKAAELDPKFVQPHISLGRYYMDQNDPAKAKEQFDLALQKEPENAVALCGLGMLLVKGGKVEDGEAMLQKALKADDNYTPCYYYLGYVYGKEGKVDDALSMFARALKLNRADMDIFLYKGRMYEEIGKQQEAAKAYRQALELALASEKGR